MVCLTRLNSSAQASMSRSEIDDIFDAASARPPKKKIKTSQCQQPETILDPSEKQPSQKRRREKKTTKADVDRFKDSRGSAPRTSSLFASSIVLNSPQVAKRSMATISTRKTNWGYLPWAEVNPSSNPPRCLLNSSCPDTPLCPFDCQCCPSPMFTPCSLLTVSVPTGF